MPEGPTPAHFPSLHDAAMAPDDVAHRSFSTTFRGYDQQEVRGFLTRVASELRVLQDRERELRRRLDALERQGPAVTAPAEPDEEQLVAVLGAEAARVLQAAREAASEIRTKAEEHVARLVREAQDEAARLRNDAEQLLDVRTGEAEQAADAIRADATREAEAEIERARARGREMVAEAQAVRERLLRDLARRRRVAQQQIEQLRAGRDRLLDAYRVVRQTLEDATAELGRAEPEARAAAEAAAHRSAGEAELSVEDLEAELMSARETGALSTGIEPQPAAVEEQALAPPPPEAEPQPAHEETEAAAPAQPEPEPAGVAQPEPEPEPAAKAEPEPAGNGDERRSSALRLLRRRREPETEREAEREGELTTVDVGDPVEGVRILRPEPRPETEPPAAAGTEVAAQEAIASPEAVAESPPVEAPDEGAAGERRPARVEELFARIRAEREASVAQAEAVLAESEPEAEAQAEAGAEAEADAPEAQPTGEPDAGDEPEAPVATTEAGEATEEALAAEEPTEPGDEALLERRDQRIEGLEQQAIRALKRVLADDQNEMLDRLRRHRGAPTADVLWPDPAAHIERYAGAVRHALAAAALEGSAFGGDGPPAAVSVDDLVDGLATELTTVLRDRISEAGDEPPSDAESTVADDDAFVRRASAAYRELKTQRVEALVRDATAAAFNRGAYAAVPEGARVRWIVDFGGRPCPDGDDDALAGPLEKGKAFPTGQCHPPAHAGCRCLLVPDTL